MPRVNATVCGEFVPVLCRGIHVPGQLCRVRPTKRLKPAHWSPALDRLWQCEVYRLVEREATAFLQSAVEGSVISRRDAGSDYESVIARAFTCG